MNTTLISTYLSNLKDWPIAQLTDFTTTISIVCNFPKKCHYKFSTVITNYTRFEVLTAVFPRIHDVWGATESLGLILDVSDESSAITFEVSNSQEEQASLNSGWVVGKVLWQNCRKLGMMFWSLHRRRKVTELTSFASLTRRVLDMKVRRWKASP